MGKKVVVISTSIRANSNSEALAESFVNGALSTGNDVDFISLKDKKIEFCKGCLACQNIGKCVINDDAAEIMDKVLDAEVVVWATPIYYYEMSGQLKTMLDRLNPLYPSDYAFTEVYFLSSAAEDEDSVPERAVNGVEGWVECFEKANFAGTVFMGGVTAPGEKPDHPALEEAREMGRKC